MTKTEGLTQLGGKTAMPASPEEAVLETVPYTRGDGPPAIVRFTCPEFTSLCPVTGQPDFAHIVIDYAPDKRLVVRNVQMTAATPTPTISTGSGRTSPQAGSMSS